MSLIFVVGVFVQIIIVLLLSVHLLQLNNTNGSEKRCAEALIITDQVKSVVELTSNPIVRRYSKTTIILY